MAYNIRYVIDVQNVIQAMPPDRKTFGYGLGIAKGTSSGRTVAGPYSSLQELVEEYGSNSEIARMGQTYFSGGWYGKPLEFYVSIVDTETIDSLDQWSSANQYAVGAKVQEDGSAYICTCAHLSPEAFNTLMWQEVEEPLEEVSAWAQDTDYTIGTVVSYTEDETTKYYECLCTHTSGDAFQVTCWDSYTPTGRDISEIMIDILAANENYYTILPSREFSKEECTKIAAAVESASTGKTVMFSVSDSDLMNPGVATDLASTLKSLNYDRSMVIYDPLNSNGQMEYENSAVASGYATVDFTAARPMLVQANKKLKGVTPLDLKSQEYNAMRNKKCNFYTKTTDIDTAMFIDGSMASGQFFDTIQCADWLAYNIMYELVNLQQRMASIPFSDTGLKMVRACIERVAVKALNANVIATGYDSEDNYIENGYLINMPTIEQIDKTDKAQRILRNVKTTFLMAGSIQAITITNDIQL